MRFLILLTAFLLTGCWAGEGLYSNKDAKQPIPAGTYRATNPEGETHLENVTWLANGMTRVGDTDGKGLYGFAPLDRQNRRWVAWYREDNGSPDEKAQLYLLLERRSSDEFVLYFPDCKGENAEIARKAGATIEKGGVDTCHFLTRASVENAMRQVRISKDVIRIVRVRGK
jgi:hypothetical protein